MNHPSRFYYRFCPLQAATLGAILGYQCTDSSSFMTFVEIEARNITLSLPAALIRMIPVIYSSEISCLT
jgi:hypothetical protein